MGLFDRFKKREESSETIQTTNQEPSTQMASDVLLQALLRNETITREQALTLPAVSGAVNLISNMIASMPVKLYKYKQGKIETVEDDTRVKLLNGDTGDTLDAWQLKNALVQDYLMDKGGYCYIRRNRNEVTGLFYVKPIFVQTIPNFKPIYKDYQILVLGEEHYKHEFIKLLRNTKDGATGVGLTEEVGKTIETAFDTLLYQLNMVKSGGNKKGFLKSQRKLGQEEINVLKRAWNNLFTNSKENVVVLNNGLEFQESSNNAVEMQMNESKKTLNDEINGLFHIYPNDFYETFKQAIYPIIKAFETSLNRELLLEKEKKNYFFEFDIKEIIKANVKERYESYKIAKETGWLSYNEIRKMENLSGIEGFDVVNVGLGSVLYDFNTHKYYTPNTDTVTSPSDGTETGSESETTESIQNILTDKVLDTEFEESGNSSAREIRFNPNHDGKTGRFSAGSGGITTISGDKLSSTSVGRTTRFEDLNDGDKEKIYSYTKGNMGDVNKALREGKEKDYHKNIIKQLDEVIDKCSPIKERTLYRTANINEIGIKMSEDDIWNKNSELFSKNTKGKAYGSKEYFDGVYNSYLQQNKENFSKIDKELKIGKEIQDRAFKSTSKDEDIVTNFQDLYVDGYGNIPSPSQVLIKYNVKSDIKGIDIGEASYVKDQSEILLERNTKQKVTKISWNDKYNVAQVDMDLYK